MSVPIILLLILDKVTQKIKTDNIKPNDTKTKAKIFKGILNEIAFKEGVELIKKWKNINITYSI